MSSQRGVAIITGACGGMGAACSRRIGRQQRLVITDRDQAALDREAGALRALGIDVAAAIAGDMRLQADIERFVNAAAQAGVLKVLVHAAGVSSSMTDWKTILDINLVATARLNDCVLPRMAPGFVAVMITSVAALTAPRGRPDLDEAVDHPLAPDFFARMERIVNTFEAEIASHYFAYGVSKYGVARLVRRCARDYAEKGARIVGVAPGVIDTPMGRLEIGPGKRGAATLEKAPMKRLGTADEIAAVVEFLVSDGASFVTGCDWLVDGGVSTAFL